MGKIKKSLFVILLLCNSYFVSAQKLHHHQTVGRMQLVKTDIHSKTGHTGGYSIWGNKLY